MSENVLTKQAQKVFDRAEAASRAQMSTLSAADGKSDMERYQRSGLHRDPARLKRRDNDSSDFGFVNRFDEHGRCLISHDYMSLL